MGFQLLPGERIEATMRPHPLWTLWWIGLALVAGLLGWGAWALFQSNGWLAAGDCGWTFWHCLYGNAVVAALLMVLVPTGLAALAAWAMRRWSLVAWTGALTIAATGVSLALGSVETVGPIALGSLALPVLVWGEVDRRRRRYVFTNLRIVLLQGVMRRRETTVRFDAIADLDRRQGPLASLLGFGELVPVTKDGAAASLPGLAPFLHRAEQLQALIVRLTVSPGEPANPQNP